MKTAEAQIVLFFSFRNTAISNLTIYCIFRYMISEATYRFKIVQIIYSSLHCEILKEIAFPRRLRGCPWALTLQGRSVIKKKEGKAILKCLLFLGLTENKWWLISIITHDHSWGICFAVCHDCAVPIHKVFLAIALRVRTLRTSATFRPYSGAEKAAPIVTQVFLHVNSNKKLLFSHSGKKY